MSKRPYCPTHDLHDDPDVDRVWHVYYCYAVDGTPLYVGISDHVPTRLLWHAMYSGSGAWYYHCARVDVTPGIRCRHEAHALEVAEIVRLRPAFNKHHNPTPQPWTAPDTRSITVYGGIAPIAWLDSVQAKSA